MPFIKKHVIGEKIEFAGQEALTKDIEKTKEISLEFSKLGLSGRGLTYKEALEIKNDFAHVDIFSKAAERALVKNNDIEILAQIKNINDFYEIIWERTVIELMFMSQYYLSLISTPQSFEKLVATKDKFDSWFTNTVSYNMIYKIKSFYIDLVKIYASKTSLDIYETDLEIKVKEILEDIKNSHIKQIKVFLSEKWEESRKKFDEWIRKENMKRNTVLFDFE